MTDTPTSRTSERRPHMTGKERDTPRNARITVTQSGRLIPMSNRPQGGPGRRSKGDRHVFGVRLPREYADRVISYAEATGNTYNDVLVDQIIRHIDELDADAVELGHNRLDVDTDAEAG